MGVLAKSWFRDTVSKLNSELVEKLLVHQPRRDFQVRLWDGTIWGAKEHPRFTLVLKHLTALRALLFSPSELALGEAYIFDDFDVEGDLEAAFQFADHLLHQEGSSGLDPRLKEQLENVAVNDRPRARLRIIEPKGQIHSPSRDRQAVRYHYDLPSDFYSLWLDRQMVYSCAYFETPEEDLDSAQERKLDYICRKLRLRAGERLLDMGCGWGGFIMYAAAHYGVKAVGITLSVPQTEVARQRLHEAGLSDCCRVEVTDYRDINGGQLYDKIVSIGMIEHVGEALLPEYFRRTWNLLRPGGVFLNHGIAYSATYHRRGPSFVDRYVFPDGELVPISSTLRAAELSGFEVRDVESLREHYALTLHHWVRRLENHADEARRVTSDTTYRIWRLYMAGAAHGFRIGRLNLYQALLVKPSQGQSGLPLSRNDWYRSSTKV
jgi:cyclopropane-fatty-acyl-phospholipid synthase